MIPKFFELMGYRWTVIVCDGPVIDRTGESLHGYCDLDNHTIQLNGSLPELDLWHTFLHEVLHATLAAVGRPKLGDDEGFVDALSGALAQVLRQGSKTKRARPRGAGKARRKQRH